MRALVQRVSEARVRLLPPDGDNEVTGEIGTGLCVLVGVTHDDTDATARKLADKVWNLRVFDDADGFMNVPVGERLLLLFGPEVMAEGEHPAERAEQRPATPAVRTATALRGAHPFHEAPDDREEQVHGEESSEEPSHAAERMTRRGVRRE